MLKKPRQTAATTTIPRLPDDVIIEILARLPVISLLKFRCVSKSWLSLISSRHFVKTHIRKSKKDAGLTHHGIMLNFSGNLKKLSVSSLLNEPTVDVLDTGYSVHLPRFSDPFVGSCDGLICLAIDRENLILWNPSTRIRKKLPGFGAEASDLSHLAYGFGYDKSSDDYKVVGYCTSEGSLSELIVKVYSLKNDQWKRIKNFKGGGLIGNVSIFANGKLHWRTFTELEPERGLKLVSLHLQTEEYRIIKMPDYLKGEFYTRLGESKGCLFVLRNHMTNGEVWIMDDYGVGKDTWTKVVTIPNIDGFLDYDDVNVLYVPKNDQVVFLCGSTFVVFDAKDCNFTLPAVRKQGGFTGAVTYVESLVSPVG